MRLPLTACLLLSLSACTWVPLDQQANAVRVLPAGAGGNCRKLGEVAVTVKDKVGFYQRDPLKVRDELETLARNEALTLKANAVAPLDQPADGSQRFAAFDCGR
ncbi:MAG: DUF4156 domain-containing protein [Pseudoxanthomonas sp.]